MIIVDNAEIRNTSNYATLRVLDGDLCFDSGGKVECVTHYHKLSQSILLELSTKYSDALMRGNTVFDTLANDPQTAEQSLNIIRNDFYQALIRLQARQSSSTPIEERLSSIVSVRASLLEDMTTALVVMTVKNGLNESLTVRVQGSANSNLFSLKLV